VNRGWIAAPPRREQLPQVVTPSGRLRIEGVVLSHLPRTLKLGGAAKGPVRQSVEVKEFAAESGLTLQAFVIQQHSDTGDGLARDWPPLDAGIDKHRAYSFQWYSLAGLALVLGVVFSFRRK
jgi:cytochrome oxidase assembly protein ShyY1